MMLYEDLLRAFDEHAMALHLIIISNKYAVLILLSHTHGLTLDMKRDPSSPL